jgi:hypothetical protein
MIKNQAMQNPQQPWCPRLDRRKEDLAMKVEVKALVGD